MLLLWEAGASGWEAKVGESLIGNIKVTNKGTVRYSLTLMGRCGSIASAQAKVEALVDQIGVEVESPKAGAEKFQPG